MILMAAAGLFRRRRAEHPPVQSSTKLESFKHEVEDYEGRYREIYEQAQWPLRIPSVRSYECLAARSTQMDECNIDPLDKGRSNVH
jgi:hypothetical protein